LPARNFLSLKIKLICLTLLATCSLVHLGAENVWGLSPAELRSRLWEEDFSFLTDPGGGERPPAEILKLGREAPYYFARIYAELDPPQAGREEQMRVLAAGKSSGVWQEAARLEMAGRLLKREEYAEVEKRARRLLRARGNGLLRPESERLLLEALYWQAEDRQLMKRLAARQEESRDAELKLFEAVAAARLQLEDWPRGFRRLFFQENAGPVHARALSFLKLEQRQARFAQPVWDYFVAKTLLYQGRNGEAVELLESALPDLWGRDVERSQIIAELGAAYFALGTLRPGADYFLGPGAGGPAGGPPGGELAALEMAGRLLRKAGETEQATRLLMRVSAESRDPGLRDRAAWFALDMAFKNGGWQTLLPSLAPGWADAGYFADLLHRQAGASLAAGSWEELRLLYDLSRSHGPADVRARLAYLLGRGLQLGLARIPGRTAASLLSEAAGQAGYYALLACAAATGLGGQPPACAHAASREEVAGGAGIPVWDEYPAPDMSSHDLLLAGFFHYGLPLVGYEKILDEKESASDALLFNAAGWLRQQGHVLESIRLAGLLADRGSSRVPELLYPRAYADELEARARQAEIKEALLYALVREESHFDPRIVSSAGAVGLTQLMPSTAADLARWLRLQDEPENGGPDMGTRLMDPAFNLELGAYHLTRLLGRVESSPALALMAYNAGLARLRSWQRRFPGLPADLLTEALPYPETRGYVRKIVVSAVAYASHYAGDPPLETVTYIFPDLKGIQP
jgi:hypothetical protein